MDEKGFEQEHKSLCLLVFVFGFFCGGDEAGSQLSRRLTEGVFFLLLFFKIGFLSVALTVLELVLWTRLATEIRLSQPPACWD